jgi:hypothetical protein
MCTPTRDEGSDFGKYPPWRFNPIFTAVKLENNSEAGEQQ